MERTEDYDGYLEMDIAVKLSQLEGCLKFLYHMNFDEYGEPVDKPRNETERQSVLKNLTRVKMLRSMYKTLLQNNPSIRTNVPAVQIANPGCMQPTKGV